MCMPRTPSAPPPVQLPAPVAPIETETLQRQRTAPPAPEKTASYFGSPEGSRVSSSSGRSSQSSSLRIPTSRRYSGLNVPNA